MQNATRFTALFALLFTITACGKLNLGNRGDHVFKDVDVIAEDPELKMSPVQISDPVQLDTWPSSDYYSESGVGNHAFTSIYDVNKLIPLRNSSPNSTVRRSSLTKDIHNALTVMKGRTAFLHSPISINQTVILSNRSGIISALDINNKYKAKWEFPVYTIAGKHMRNVDQISLSYGDGMIFIVTNNGYIIAVDEDTGNLVWSKKQNFPIRAPLKYSSNRLYGISSLGQFFILSSSDGEELVMRAGTPVRKVTKTQPSVLIGNKSAIVSYPNGDLMAFDLITGDLRWSQDLAQANADGLFLMSDIDFIPAFVQGMIIAGSINGGTYLIREDDGQIVWNKSISLGSNIIVDEDFTFFIDTRDNLIAMHWPTGGIKWSKKLPSDTKMLLPKYLNDNQMYKTTPILKRGPIMANGKILVFTNNGELIVISPHTGYIESKYIIPYNITDPIIVNSTIYLISYDLKKLVVIK